MRCVQSLLVQAAQEGEERAKQHAQQANSAAESAQRHAEWQDRRIAELETQVCPLEAPEDFVAEVQRAGIQGITATEWMYFPAEAPARHHLRPGC